MMSNKSSDLVRDIYEPGWRAREKAHWGKLLEAVPTCKPDLHAERDALRAELSRQVDLVEKCMVAMNENADRGQKAEAENQRLRANNLTLTEAVMQAYGILWCINTEPMAPVPMLDPERAAAKARLILKEMLCHEQMGIAINTARAALGDE
jgi:hypothetical protein